MATLYKSVDATGKRIDLHAGSYTNRALREIRDDWTEIESIRLSRGTFALVSSGSFADPRDPAHVLQGPTVWNRGDFQFRSIRIDKVRPDDFGLGASLTLFYGYNCDGLSRVVGDGTYTANDLQPESNGLSGTRLDQVRSLRVGPGTLVVLTGATTTYIYDSGCVRDLDSYVEGLSRIDVYSVETPTRPAKPHNPEPEARVIVVHKTTTGSHVADMPIPGLIVLIILITMVTNAIYGTNWSVLTGRARNVALA